MSETTQPLRDHHKHCDDLFAAAEEAAQQAQWAKCNERFMNFRRAIESHFSAEETILFPAFEEESGMTDGPTEVMRSEHAQMRGLMEQMAQAVAAQDSNGFCGTGETLLVLMQQHNFKEENILYPMCDHHLSALDEDIGDRLRTVLVSA